MSAVVDSSQRIEPGSFNHKPYPWPKSAQDPNPDAAAIAQQCIDTFNTALGDADYEKLASLFVEDGFWRDHLAVSWALRTIKGRANIRDFLTAQCSLTKVSIDTSTDHAKPQVNNFAPAGDSKGIAFQITFTTKHGSGRGIVRMIEVDSVFRIWTFFTSLEGLTGHEEPTGPRRPNGVEHGANPERKNWLDRRRDEVEFRNAEPDVLIIGAGQAGLTAAARLKMLNVPTLIIDQNDGVGGNWRGRYHQLVLHDPVWYDHLPYLPFPSFWPIFTPKDKVADWFQSYAQALELNVWTQTTLSAHTFDPKTQKWTVTLVRAHPDGRRETRTLQPKHVVQCTGASGKKNFPYIPGIDTFKGDLLCHSSDFPGAKRTQTKKKAIVIGACNSSHDICQDYYENGYDVTMVQRSSTCVISSESLLKISVGGLYEEGARPVEDADLWVMGWPAEVMKSIQVDVTTLQRQNIDGALLAGLEAAGFKTDRGIDNAGLMAKYLQRGGGYYIDVGMSQLIIDGKVAVKQGQEIAEVLPRGLRFADGSELEADEIIFATGYANMRTQARAIFGDELADSVGDVWGWDEEGEMRGIWRESGRPGFWFHGGNIALCRYNSRLLALQIKAKLEGLS